MKGVHYTNDWVMYVSDYKKNTLFHGQRDSVLDNRFLVLLLKFKHY